MKKHTIVKRIISLLLAIVLVVSMVSASGTEKVEAANATVKVTGYESYPKEENGYWQLILKTDENLNTKYPSGTLQGEVQIGDTAKTINWYIGDNLIYTVDLTYEDYLNADKLVVADGAEFTLVGDSSTKIKFKKGLELVQKQGTWVNADSNFVSYPITDYEIYRIENETQQFYQLIIKSDVDLRNTTLNPLTGSVLLDGKAKSVEWYVDEGSGLVYTVGITLEEGDAATKIEIPKGNLFTILDDTNNVVEITESLKLAKDDDGDWLLDTEYNEVEISFASYIAEQEGFYLNAKITAGPDKGKNIEDVYGDWLTATTGVITYNDDQIMKNVCFSTATGVLWVNNIQDLDKLTTIEFKKGTVLKPDVTAKCKVPMSLANDLKLVYKDGTWIVYAEEEVVTKSKITNYESYPKETEGFWQLILKTDKNLNELYPGGILEGSVKIGDTTRTIEWYIEDNLIYTTGLTYKEYQNADKLVIADGSVFTLSTDPSKKIEFTTGLKLAKIDGIWVTDEGQTKIEYNDVKISFASSDERGFYLNAEIVAGPNKGKDIGGADAYGDWKTTATGDMTYNGNKTMSVYFSTAGTTLYISGDYDLAKLKKVEFKKGTILTPMVGAQCNTLMRLKNDLKLVCKDGKWVVDSDKEVVTNSPATDYEIYPKEEDGFCQLILKTETNLNTLYPNGTLLGKIQIGNKTKEVEWYIGDYLIYTTGITWDEYLSANKLVVADNAVFTLSTDPSKKIKITKGLKLVKKKDTWVKSDVKTVEYPITNYELYRIENKKQEFYQLVLKSNVDLRDTTVMPLTGSILIDGKSKQVEWYVDETNGLVYTVGITLEEGDKATHIEVPTGSIFTILNDTENAIEITEGLKLVQIDGIWVLDEGQTKLDYNDVQISLSSGDGKGFYLNAEIVAGPDAGKTLGADDVYGDWKSTASGTMIYNGDQEMDVWFSTTGAMLYVSGDYNLDEITSIEFKAGTVLIPIEGAQKKTMLRLANDLKLAKDTRYNRWVLAGQENADYNFNDVQIGVTRVTGAVLELKGTFVNKTSTKLMEVYGDWVILNGAVTLGDPSTGTRTDSGAIWSLAGENLMLYGIQAGLMDSITIQAGTILWPDSSCLSADPIRIANDVILQRDEEDEWVIVAGKAAASNKNIQNTETEAVEEEATTEGVETISTDSSEAKVRLVDENAQEKKSEDATAIAASGNTFVYVGIAVIVVIICVLLAAFVIWRNTAAKKTKQEEKGE